MATYEDPTESGDPPSNREHPHHHHLLLTRGDRLIATVFLAVATGMVPWTVFLGLSLPLKYNAGHWRLLWTGFDVALICVLGYAAWAAWFHRQILATTAIVAGTLLLCDAWFDIITSAGHSDHWVTLLTGLGGEIPLGIFFLWLYRRIVLKSLAEFHRLLGDALPPRRLREAHILLLSARPPMPSEMPCPPTSEPRV